MAYISLLEGTSFETVATDVLATHINEAYRVVGGHVLHLCVELPNLDETEQLVAGRYFQPEKGKRITGYLGIVPPDPDIQVPTIEVYGQTVTESNGTVNFWMERVLSGQYAACTRDFAFDQYGKVLEWAARLSKEPITEPMALRDYYKQRHAALSYVVARGMGTECVPPHQALLLDKALTQYAQLANRSVGDNEQTRNIHGDLTRSNIFMNTTTDTISVFDFEWGAAEAGDFIRDPQKLLRLDHNYFDTPGEYSPHLSLDEKETLLVAYLESMGAYMEMLDQPTLRKRILLTGLDAFLTRIASDVLYRREAKRDFIWHYSVDTTYEILEKICKDAEKALKE